MNTKPNQTIIMNHSNQPTRQTTAQIYQSMLARHALESEPRPAFDITGTNVICTNEDAMPGQKNYVVVFTPRDAAMPYQKFNGKHWDNFPA